MPIRDGGPRPGQGARDGAGGSRLTGNRRRPSVALALTAAGCLVVAGCAAAVPPRHVAALPASGATSFAKVRGAAQSPAGRAATPTTATRALIRTANLTVRVAEVRAALGRAADLAVANGGYVQSEELGAPEPFVVGPVPYAQAGHGTAPRFASALVTVRVPAATFERTVSTLASLGALVSELISTRDVTQQVVNVASRIETARAAVARLRTLFARARTVAGVLAVQAALAREEANLESFQAQAALLARQTQLMTVTATFLAAVRPLHQTGSGGFQSGLIAGWNALTAAGRALLTAVGFALPWILVLGVLGALAWWAWRRGPARRQRRPPATPTAPGSTLAE